MKRKYVTFFLSVLVIISVFFIFIYLLYPTLTGNVLFEKTALKKIAVKDTQDTEKTGTTATTSSGPKTPYERFLLSTSPPGVTDFYGSFKVANLNAPSGYVVEAKTTAGDVCGSFSVNPTQPGEGLYGFLHCTCGGDMPDCNNDDISFYWNSYSLNELGPSDSTWSDGSIKNVNIEFPFVCGDVNLNKAINAADLIFLVNHVFKGGPPPFNNDLGDVNNDGRITSGDIIYLVNFIFKSGPPPCGDSSVSSYLQQPTDLERQQTEEDLAAVGITIDL